MNQLPMNQLETASGGKMSKIIVANWKMNGSNAFIDIFFQKLVTKSPHKIIFCPPFPYLGAVSSHIKECHYYLGAQDCHTHSAGAFTGDISAEMLIDTGCQYVILGHSERRQYHNETNEDVFKKSEVALHNGLTPIICVGETLNDRTAKNHLDVVKQQLIQSIPPTTSPLIIAYEPVWAIGTGLTATLNDIVEMHQMIATHCQQKHKVLYGGSVTADNAAEILAQPNVDGVLVGGASLKSEMLNMIMR